jgi:hypothetical protein
MKTINIINNAMMIGIGLLISAAVQAQDKYKTSESVGKQLKENSVPGLKYGPESQQKQAKKAVDPKQDTKGEIRDIIFTGGSPAPTSQNSTTSRAALSKSAPSKLPSDAIAPEKIEKKEVVVPKPPSQGDEKKTN